MDDTKPPIWHDGERALQAHVGVEERMVELGARVIRPFMPDQHRAFYGQLPFVILGSVDAAGAAWATVVEGEPGFLSSPAPASLLLGGCCQSNANRSPLGGAGAKVSQLQAASDCHSTSAVERRSLKVCRSTRWRSWEK